MASKGASQAGTSGQPPQAVSRVTRSSSKPAAPAPSKENGPNLGQKKIKFVAGEEARGVLTKVNCLLADEQVTQGTLYKIYKRILVRYDETIPPDLRIPMQAFAVILHECEGAHNRVMETLTQKIEEKMERALDKSMEKISTVVESALANQKELQTTTETLAGTTQTLQKLTADMTISVREATANSDQLSTTITSYKDALLKTVKSTAPTREAAPPITGQYEDPRLTRDLDRKKRQFLLEFTNGESEGKSITELKERIDIALSNITPPPPEGAKVQEINKLRNGGLIIQLMSMEAADWLRDPMNEFTFIHELDLNANIKDRVYPILVPRIPISFDPSNQDHLREVESTNNLAPETIKNARWIKPEYRRSHRQKFAYATLTLNSALEANRLIRDGIYVCNTRTYPKRLKYEPKQCMKCRKWGHFAMDCHASINTCGTCGEEHATRDCNKPNKRYCVACRSNEHASWDRNCPDFLRKSAQFDELHPENALTYFPTEESWTLIARPERIPLDERFPNRHAVISLPPPNHAGRPPPTRTMERKRKQRGGNKGNSAQGTLDEFISSHPPLQHVRAANEDLNDDEQGKLEDKAVDDLPSHNKTWN